MSPYLFHILLALNLLSLSIQDLLNICRTQVFESLEEMAKRTNKQRNRQILKQKIKMTKQTKKKVVFLGFFFFQISYLVPSDCYMFYHFLCDSTTCAGLYKTSNANFISGLNKVQCYWKIIYFSRTEIMNMYPLLVLALQMPS